MKKITEDGAGSSGAVMNAGSGDFTNNAPAKGPVAGFDPIMGMRNSFKNRVKRAAKRGLKMRAGEPPRPWAPIGDCV